jgi:hypothetical protein
MKPENISQAMAASRDFVRACFMLEARKTALRCQGEQVDRYNIRKQTAAVKRASLELTRELSRMRCER